MANIIKIKRGSNASLPSLNEAELAFTTDTRQLYAGTTSGNKELFKDIPFPTGGLTGELLVKKSDADYDAEWQDLLGKVVYKRRIMVGDDLDNRTIYFTFPDDYVPTTTGTVGHEIISGQYSGIWEQPSSNDPMDTEILISGPGLLRTIYNPKNPSAKLTSTNIGAEEIGEITAINSSNPSYRHCYITNSYMKSLQVGDTVGGNMEIYFNFPDNLHSQLVDLDDDTILLEVDNVPKLRYFIDTTTENQIYHSISDNRITGEHEITIYSFNTTTSKVTRNESYSDLRLNSILQTVTYINEQIQPYMMIDPREFRGVVSQEGFLEGYDLVINADFNTANYSSSQVVEAVDNYVSQNNYPLEDMLSLLGIDINNEIVSLQGNNISMQNYEILKGFDMYVADGAGEYLDPYNEGLISDENGHFVMRIGDLIDKNSQDYLFMILNPNSGDVYFYQIDEVDMSKGDCLIEFNIFPDYQIVGPYFLLKRK